MRLVQFAAFFLKSRISAYKNLRKRLRRENQAAKACKVDWWWCENQRKRVAAASGASDFEEARQEDATKAPRELAAFRVWDCAGPRWGPGRNSPRLGRRRVRRCRGPRAPGAAAAGAGGRRRPRPPTPASAASSAAWRAFNSLLFGLWLADWLAQAGGLISLAPRYYCTHLMNDWASPLSVGGARSFHSSAPNQWTCAPTHTLHLSARRRPTPPTPGTFPCCSRQRSF